jgi:hypothetical protein
MWVSNWGIGEEEREKWMNDRMSTQDEFDVVEGESASATFEGLRNT